MFSDVIIVNRKVSVKKKRRTGLYTFGAFMCVSLGVVSLMSAFLLIIIAAMTGSGFDGVEVILIVASFTLVGIGAHCLDLLDKSRRDQKIENYKFCTKDKKSF